MFVLGYFSKKDKMMAVRFGGDVKLSHYKFDPSWQGNVCQKGSSSVEGAELKGGRPPNIYELLLDEVFAFSYFISYACPIT